MSVRKLIPAVFVLTVVASLVLAGPLIGRYFKAPTTSRRQILIQPPTEMVYLENEHRAQALEREGLMEDAVKEYTAALSAKSAEITRNSLESLRRIEENKNRLGWFFGIAAFVARLSTAIRIPVVLALVAIFLALFLRFLVPRSGSRITEFSVVGSLDSKASLSFQTSFLLLSNEIRQIYVSKFARRFGMALSFDAYEGSPHSGGNLLEEALAEAGALETKAVARFALTGAIRWFAHLLIRPSILITGSIQLLPGGAKVSARLKDCKTNKTTIIGATSVELSTLEKRAKMGVLKTFFQAPVNPNSSAKGEELRQITAQLTALAMVLACKIRYLESSTLRTNYRPASWETVCIVTAIGRKLQ